MPQHKLPNIITASGDAATLTIISPTYGTQVITFDAADIPLVQAKQWRLIRPSGREGRPFYACTGHDDEFQYMHQLLCPGDLQVDHVDGNTLNNCRTNLRILTVQKNQWNRLKAKGYSFEKWSNRWRASIRANGKVLNLGRYDTEAEARAAYEAAKLKYHVI